MIKISEIKKLKEFYVNDLYPNLRKEQKTDDEFYRDKFSVPWIKEPYEVVHTGKAARMIDSPTEHIITSNPQVEVWSEKKTQKDAIERIAQVFNQVWIPYIKSVVPNPPKNHVRNQLHWGESWIQLGHNALWVTGKKEKKGLPVLFYLPHPLTIYTDPPKQGDYAIPKRLIVLQDRAYWMVKSKYPEWEADGKKRVVTWLEYWDEDMCYAEAGGKPVWGAEGKRNIYGVVPFIRQLSGFGSGSEDGDLANIIVGRLRNSRSLLEKQCAVSSMLDSGIHLFTNPLYQLLQEEGVNISDEQVDAIDITAGGIVSMPPGTKLVEFPRIPPSAELFTYYAAIDAELDREDPAVLAGLPTGTSGRQQNMAGVSAMRRYATNVEGTENAFSVAFQMALKIIKSVPTLYEETGLKKSDLDIPVQIKCKLKAADPIEDDRKSTLGIKLQEGRIIDWLTNLTRYQGYTQDEAEDIIARTLAYTWMFSSPDIAELVALRGAEKSGMLGDLKVLMARRGQSGMTPPGAEQRTATDRARTMGETGSPLGREMIDEALTARSQRESPTPYFQE